jgi:hypothetical protein
MCERSPAILTRRERRRTGRPGKSDPSGALVIARVVAREEHLPPRCPKRRRVISKRSSTNLDQLISERTRVQTAYMPTFRFSFPGTGSRFVGSQPRRSALVRPRCLRIVGHHG